MDLEYSPSLGLTQNGIISDIKVIIFGKEYCLHKAILASHSQYFLGWCSFPNSDNKEENTSINTYKSLHLDENKNWNRNELKDNDCQNKNKIHSRDICELVKVPFGEKELIFFLDWAYGAISSQKINLDDIIFRCDFVDLMFLIEYLIVPPMETAIKKNSEVVEPYFKLICQCYEDGLYDFVFETVEIAEQLERVASKSGPLERLMVRIAYSIRLIDLNQPNISPTLHRILMMEFNYALRPHVTTLFTFPKLKYALSFYQVELCIPTSYDMYLLLKDIMDHHQHLDKEEKYELLKIIIQKDQFLLGLDKSQFQEVFYSGLFPRCLWTANAFDLNRSGEWKYVVGGKFTSVWEKVDIVISNEQKQTIEINKAGWWAPVEVSVNCDHLDYLNVKSLNRLERKCGTLSACGNRSWRITYSFKK